MTRERLEWSCRLLAIVALVLATLDLVARAMGRATAAADSPVASAVVLHADAAVQHDSVAERDLTTFTRTAAGAAGAQRDSLALTLTGVPSAAVRAAIGAARAAGVGVRWRAPDTIAALALQVEPASGAVAGVMVRASIDAPGAHAARAAARAAALRDDGGVLDSAQVTSSVRAWRLAQRAPGLAYTASGTVARAAVSVTPMANAAPKPRVLLVAAPGWEAKFVAAALEEAGWVVDGRLALSPSGAVTLGDAAQSGPPVPREAQHAVVVLLDSVLPAPFAIDTRTLDRFVRRGGGVVFAGDALRSAAARALAPARISASGNAAATRGGVVGALRTPLPRLGLDAWRLTPTPDAIVLQADTIDTRTVAPAVIARRVGAGRVVAAAYRETWRWRMEGTDAGVAEHRAWWDRVLAAAALRAPSAAVDADTAVSVSDPYPGDAAPWADLIAHAGAPMPASSRIPTTARPRTWPDRQAILFAIAALALLCEWASRRLRGFP